MPVVYFGNLLVSSLLYPGYSHVTQYASELGSSAARYPAVFNTGVVLVGVAALGAAAGFFAALRSRGSGRVLAGAVAALVALFGVAMVMGGLFPMPDPRHGGFGLGMGIHLVPALLAWGLRHRPELRTLRLLLWASFVAMVAMFAVMMGVGELVTRANVGVFQRVYATTLFPWIGVAAFALSSPAAQAAPSASLRPAPGAG